MLLKINIKTVMVDNDYKTNLKELYKCHCCYQNSIGRVTIVHWSGWFFSVLYHCVE